jgi:hypothetical protein
MPNTVTLLPPPLHGIMFSHVFAGFWLLVGLGVEVLGVLTVAALDVELAEGSTGRESNSTFASQIW